MAGEPQEHVVERRPTQTDVCDGDPGRRRGSAETSVSAATRRAIGTLRRPVDGSKASLAPATRPAMDDGGAEVGCIGDDDLETVAADAEP